MLRISFVFSSYLATDGLGSGYLLFLVILGNIKFVMIKKYNFVLFEFQHGQTASLKSQCQTKLQVFSGPYRIKTLCVRHKFLLDLLTVKAA
jgi:hypothetical protein